MSNIPEEGVSLPSDVVSPRVNNIAKITQPLAETTLPQAARRTRPLALEESDECTFSTTVVQEPVTPTDLPPFTEVDTSTTKTVFAPTTDPMPSALRSKLRKRTTLRQKVARHKIFALILLILLLLGISISAIEGALLGMNAYNTYTELHHYATDGVQHLLNVKTIFAGTKTSSSSSSGSLSKVLDTTTLAQAQKELSASHDDFTRVLTLLKTSSVIALVEQYSAHYRDEIVSARAASQVGLDITDIGQVALKTASVLAPQLRGPLLTNSQSPLLTASDLTLIGTTIDTILPYLDDIQLQAKNMSLAALPISAHQREQVQQVLQLLPSVENYLVQGRSMLGAFGWLLGIDGPRTFLVQTMDRGELRPTGGFTGQYGELKISGGRVAPFSLRDISLIEYATNSPTTDQSAPAAYRSWWPFANWGLRDSNLSADFPTSAKIAISEYQRETGHKVDGVILFTPFLIEQVLQVTGPIQIPSYGETITSQNLEARLHYYQLDNAGIAKQIRISGGNTSTSDRKQFTSLVAQTLMSTLRHEPPTMLLALAKQMFSAMKTKDLQVYLSNTQLEGFLAQNGDAVQVDRSTTHDGFYVVQANVSASKASQYVKTTIHDTVTIDKNGGATHLFQMQLAYNQLGFVYGLDTYRDYVRVYVPTTAKFLSGDGFDTGTALCGGPLADCAQTGVYPQNEMICAAGDYFAGASAPMLNDPYTGEWHPLDTVGPPTNYTSDEAGRAMFAGYVVIPKNCTMTVTLSWYVPPMGKGVYSLLVQRQAATFPELQLTILPTPSNCAILQTEGLHIDNVLDQDTLYTLTKGSTGASCYPQPRI